MNSSGSPDEFVRRQFLRLAPAAGHRPDRLRYDAVPGHRTEPDARRRRASAGVPNAPVHHRTGDVTVATGIDDTAMNRQWERNTSENVNLTSTTHAITEAGNHVLKFWMVDPTVVLQKIVVDLGGLRPSYLGPPESHRI
jgi:hypothetical protein